MTTFLKVFFLNIYLYNKKMEAHTYYTFDVVYTLENQLELSSFSHTYFT